MRAQAGDAEIKQTGRTQKSGSRRDMGLTYLKGRTGQGVRGAGQGRGKKNREDSAFWPLTIRILVCVWYAVLQIIETNQSFFLTEKFKIF